MFTRFVLLIITGCAGNEQNTQSYLAGDRGGIDAGFRSLVMVFTLRRQTVELRR